MPNLPSAGLRGRVALDKHGFLNARSLGQNFLLDDALLEGLLDAAGVAAGDNVLEIGPGAGVMTALMAGRGAKVIAVELDEKLRPVLADVLAPYDGAEVVFADFMRCDWESIVRGRFGGAPWRVVANLPYYITSDALVRLTTGRERPQSISVMVQREAAERIMSRPGEKSWCAMAALLRFYGAAEKLADVPRSAFEPAPHVDSAFLRLTAIPGGAVKVDSEAMMFKTIRAAFAMRRKKLINNLKSAFSLSREEAGEALRQAGLDADVRGETLEMSDLAALSDTLGRLDLIRS